MVFFGTILVLGGGVLGWLSAEFCARPWAGDSERALRFITLLNRVLAVAFTIVGVVLIIAGIATDDWVA
jgi:hypothetical protein